MAVLPQLIVNGAILACIYALLALGFATIFGATRIFHFAHGSVFSVAAYLVFFGTVVAQWPFLAAALLAIAGATLLGVLIDVVAYEPLISRGSTQLAIFITSLGLFILFDSLVSLPFGRSPLVVPNTLLPSAPIEVASAYITPPQLLLVSVSVALLVAVPVFFVHTRLGVAIRALAGDPTLAEVLGVDVRATRVAVFALGSSLAAVGAALTTLDTGVIDPTINLNAVLVATVAVIIGGIGSITGATLGGILLGIFRTIAVGFLSSQWADLIVFSLVLAVVMFRPRGLMGTKLSRLGR